MKRTVITIFCMFSLMTSQAQNNFKDGIIELARAYKNYMFGAEPSKKKLKELRSNNSSDSLQLTSLFVLESLKTGNKILQPKYLKLPDEHSLKSIYIMSEISENMREEGGPSNSVLVDSLQNSNIKREVLIDGYYRVAFVANGNKNKPFNLKKYDFDINSYNLKTDIEMGIFFLRCMEACGSQIWGFMNIPRPPNTSKAIGLIGKFPKINGQEYYKYTDLYFKDFDFIYSDSLQSYKGVFVHKYYDLLLNHLICLNKEKKRRNRHPITTTLIIA